MAFPFAAQAGQLTRQIETPAKPLSLPEVEYLLTSRPAGQLSAEQMLKADRAYWGIENGLHQRLDVIAGEDRSRVKHPNAVLNLAVIRRAVLSVAVYWTARCKNRRLATLSGFFDSMSAQNAKTAVKVVTTCNPSWLPSS